MPDPDLETRLTAALAEPYRRVRPVDLPDGRRFWLKRVERLTGVMRLQKGDPQRAFSSEVAGLKALAEAALPVAEVVAEGPDWVLLPDAGPILPRLVQDPAVSDAEKLMALGRAGRALGQVHWAGMAHGRPAVRDICWDGKDARFIDLERFRHARRSGVWQAADVVMLVQTAFTQWPDDPRWIDAALESYAVNAPPEALAAVRRLTRRLAPLGWLAGPVARLRPKSREVRAVRLTLERLRQV